MAAPDYIPNDCICCGKTTRSHQTLNGVLCHTCYEDRTDDEIRAAARAEPFDGDETTLLECLYCGSQTTPKAADSYGRHAGYLIEEKESPDVPWMPTDCQYVWVQQCPNCDRGTGYPTTETTAQALLAGVDRLSTLLDRDSHG